MDFPEQGNGDQPREVLAARVAELAQACAGKVATFEVGRALTDGVSVALVGPVNAGKSSLFNRLIGRERALVAAEPGTTRDFVEAQVVWDGLAITLVDTAGQREQAVGLERRGIELGGRRTAQADVVVEVRAADTFDSDTLCEAATDAGSSAGARVVQVVNKADLGGGTAEGWLRTSATSGLGLEELKRHIVIAAVGDHRGEREAALVTSERQRGHLERAAGAFASGQARLEDGSPEEIVALEMRVGRDALGQVLMAPPDDAVLDALFARFCIGK